MKMRSPQSRTSRSRTAVHADSAPSSLPRPRMQPPHARSPVSVPFCAFALLFETVLSLRRNKRVKAKSQLCASRCANWEDTDDPGPSLALFVGPFHDQATSAPRRASRNSMPPTSRESEKVFSPGFLYSNRYANNPSLSENPPTEPKYIHNDTPRALRNTWGISQHKATSVPQSASRNPMRPTSRESEESFLRGSPRFRTKEKRPGGRVEQMFRFWTRTRIFSTHPDDTPERLLDARHAVVQKVSLYLTEISKKTRNRFDSFCG